MSTLPPPPATLDAIARGTAAAEEAHARGWPADAGGPWPHKSAESQAWRDAYQARRAALAAQVTR